MNDLMSAMSAQTSASVQIWMGWMVLIFLASVFFVRTHVQAQRTLLALLATAFGGYILWTMTENVHLLGIVHLIIWTPLAWYLWQTLLSKRARKHDGEADIGKYQTPKYKAFFWWACLLFGTIIVSLIFDVRDIILVMTGLK